MNRAQRRSQKPDAEPKIEVTPIQVSDTTFLLDLIADPENQPYIRLGLSTQVGITYGFADPGTAVALAQNLIDAVRVISEATGRDILAEITLEHQAAANDESAYIDPESKRIVVPESKIIIPGR